MSLDFNFSQEELKAAEAATANPYLSDPTRALQLLAQLISQPTLDARQEAQQAQLNRLHTLIHQDFIGLATQSGHPDTAQSLHKLLALEEDLNTTASCLELAGKTLIGVGGGFSAGKSRFLNTLLGVELLPEALEPTTAIPSVIIRGEDCITALNLFNYSITLNFAAFQAITHAFNDQYGGHQEKNFSFAGILKRLILKQTGLPWEHLAFLDTPGYSKADATGSPQTDQEIALQQLAQANQVLWLLSAKNGSIRQDDLDFLCQLNHPHPIFFVITQADLVGAGIEAIMKSTRQAINRAGLSCAGLMAWAAPPCEGRGKPVAGEDIFAWLDRVNQPVYSEYRHTGEQVLDSYIRHNQQCLARNRKSLALLNSLRVDQVLKDDHSVLQEHIQEQRQAQKTLKAQAAQFAALKDDLLEVLQSLLAAAADKPTSLELIQQAEEHHKRGEYSQEAALLLQAAEQGHAEAQFRLGQHYLGKRQSSALNWLIRFFNEEQDVENKKSAILWLNKAAEQGHAEAQHLLVETEFQLGERYYLGQKVRKDPKIAVEWFCRAAEFGHADAQFRLGECYYLGHGLPVDNETAARWFRKAAEQGHADAQFRLGECYYLGHGLPVDNETAARWFRKAAEQGHADAQFRLGMCYYFGRGLPENEETAARWFRKAAEQGHADAQFRLGWCYYFGHGLPENKETAARWFRKAAAQQHTEAQAFLDSMS